jgi:hypothetical protein
METERDPGNEDGDNYLFAGTQLDNRNGYHPEDNDDDDDNYANFATTQADGAANSSSILGARETLADNDDDRDREEVKSGVVNLSNQFDDDDVSVLRPPQLFVSQTQTQQSQFLLSMDVAHPIGHNHDGNNEDSHIGSEKDAEQLDAIVREIQNSIQSSPSAHGMAVQAASAEDGDGDLESEGNDVDDDNDHDIEDPDSEDSAVTVPIPNLCVSQSQSQQLSASQFQSQSQLQLLSYTTSQEYTRCGSPTQIIAPIEEDREQMQVAPEESVAEVDPAPNKDPARKSSYDASLSLSLSAGHFSPEVQVPKSVNPTPKSSPVKFDYREGWYFVRYCDIIVVWLTQFCVQKLKLMTLTKMLLTRLMPKIPVFPLAKTS